MNAPDANPSFVTIPRGRIRVAGEDRHAFLQALVTNDLDRLASAPALYSCLLTPQGKFLHDFFIVTAGDTLWIDCEGGARAQDLHRRLSMYRLRSKVTLELEPDTFIYANSSAGWADPRDARLGRRAFEKPDGIEAPFAVWDDMRIRAGVPDGSRDIAVEQASLIESNLDRLKAVSFEKGCYIGQELTARMHHRGLAKRHLYAVEWKDAPPLPGSDITVDGKLIGSARSHCGQVGLASLKDEYAGDNALFKVIT